MSSSKILGFTLEKIDAAECFLTPKGLKKLRPCKLALLEFLQDYPQGGKVGTRLLQRYQHEAPSVWLTPDPKGNWLGPKGGWGWITGDQARYKLRCHLRTKPVEQARYLKAYIMKHGRRGR